MMNCVNTHLIIKPAAQKSDGLFAYFKNSYSNSVGTISVL